MGLIIGIFAIAIITCSILGKNGCSKSPKKRDKKSFFFEGGDDFTAEDYIFMEMMEEEENE